jgi:hypothetical protein
LRSHGKAILRGDLDDVVANYAEDAVLITPHGAHRGRTSIREAQARILRELAGLQFTYLTNISDGGAVFLEWSAEGEDRTVDNGVDTIIIDGGAIRVQTVRYTVRTKSAPAGSAL